MAVMMALFKIDFNSRPREEASCRARTPRCSRRNFNSRPREEASFPPRNVPFCLRISILAPVRRRLVVTMAGICCSLISILAPVRRRPILNHADISCFSFQFSPP